IVEIVRDASRETADALDFLGLNQTLFEHAPIGYVSGDAEVTLTVHTGPVAALDDAGGRARRAYAMLALCFPQREELSPRSDELALAVQQQLVERPAHQLIAGD